jgi:hypothetical protein
VRWWESMRPPRRKRARRARGQGKGNRGAFGERGDRGVASGTASRRGMGLRRKGPEISSLTGSGGKDFLTLTRYEEPMCHGGNRCVRHQKSAPRGGRAGELGHGAGKRGIEGHREAGISGILRGRAGTPPRQGRGTPRQGRDAPPPLRHPCAVDASVDRDLWIIETKGREDIHDSAKWNLLLQWCADATELDADRTYNALFVRQEVWEEYRPGNHWSRFVAANHVKPELDSSPRQPYASPSQ